MLKIRLRSKENGRFVYFRELVWWCGGMIWLRYYPISIRLSMSAASPNKKLRHGPQSISALEPLLSPTA